MLVAPAEALYTHSFASAYSVARRSLLRRLGDQAGTSEEGERQAQPKSIRWRRVAVAAVLAFGIKEERHDRDVDPGTELGW